MPVPHLGSECFSAFYGQMTSLSPITTCHQTTAQPTRNRLKDIAEKYDHQNSPIKPKQQKVGLLFSFLMDFREGNVAGIIWQYGIRGKPWMSAVLIELRRSTKVMDGLSDMGHNGCKLKTEPEGESWQPGSQPAESFWLTVFRPTVFLSGSLSRTTHLCETNNAVWAETFLDACRQFHLLRENNAWKEMGCRKLSRWGVLNIRMVVSVSRGMSHFSTNMSALTHFLCTVKVSQTTVLFH